MRTHGGLTEDSRSHVVRTPDRKGREGKGREKEERAGVIHPQVEAADRAAETNQQAVSCPTMNELRR